jgi:hypothetical protein
MDHRRSIPVQETLVHGVNWAPDSCDEDDDCEPGNTEVPDVLVSSPDSSPVSTMAEGDEAEVVAALMELASEVPDVVDALMELASTEVSTFRSDKERAKCSKLLLPVFLPRLYGNHKQMSMMPR